MSVQSRIEKTLNRVYKPEKVEYKRSFLFWVSLFILIVLFTMGITQYNYHWARETLWTLLYLFSAISFIGIFTATFGSDFWVALVLGDI